MTASTKWRFGDVSAVLIGGGHVISVTDWLVLLRAHGSLRTYATGTHTNIVPASLVKERIDLMSDKTIGFEGNEDELLSFQVSDEALETAAGVGIEKAGAYTISLLRSEHLPGVMG